MKNMCVSNKPCCSGFLKSGRDRDLAPQELCPIAPYFSSLLSLFTSQDRWGWVGGQSPSIWVDD